ncbi:MAG TPA: type II secretion system protein [Candidatus Limnocylindrales bacterium]|nr:type II secretion system protein [Candidatus Limnocylindrales bacterium]
MNKINNSKSTFIPKGFTLIELLVVISVLGILAVGLISTIDPVDKINASNDTKVLNDVGLVARAAENYAASNNGAYPTTEAILISSGNLKSAPIDPDGAGTKWTYNPTYSATAFSMTATLFSKKSLAASGGATAFAKYDSVTGKQCIVAAVGTGCP